MTTYFRADDLEQDPEIQTLGGADADRVGPNNNEDDLAEDAELGNDDTNGA